MRRIFIPGRMKERLTLTGDDAHHIGWSVRARAGDRCEALDGENDLYLMEIVSFTRDTVTLKRVEPLGKEEEPPSDITLAVCLPKGDKMDFIVQKAAELGAAAVQPLVSANSVVRYDEKKRAAKREKWQRISDEAAKQCARSSLLRVGAVMELSDWLRAFDPSGRAAFFCYEREKEKSLSDFLKSANEKSFVILTGPEGGFTPEEAESAERAGISPTSLGRRILRAETAVIAALAITQYEKGDVGNCHGRHS